MKRFTTTVVATKVTLRRTVLTALMLALSTFSIATADELVANGSFEYPELTGPSSWMTFFGQNYTGGDTCPPGSLSCNDGTLIPGWDVVWSHPLIQDPNWVPEPGRIELQSDRFPIIANCPAKDGFQKAELDSHHRVGATIHGDNNATIYQTVDTCPSMRYTLTYSWKGRLQLPLHNSDLDVLIDDIVINTHNNFGLSWSNETYNFTASDFDALLAFHSCGDGTTFGVFLDAVGIDGMDGSNPELCDEPDNLCLTDKPKSLVLLYDGNDDTSHQQTSDEVIIDPMVVANYPNPAYIKVFSHNKNRPAMFAGTYRIGDLITVTGPRNRIPPRLMFEIYSLQDLETPVQTVQFHTSCSQPLFAGDEFGGITVWSAGQ